MFHTQKPTWSAGRLAPAKRRAGQTLLELTVASFLVAVIILPCAQFMRQAIQISRKIENANAMVTLCTGKLEEHLSRAAISFTPAVAAGDFDDEGYSELKYWVECSDRIAAGGRPGQLMAVTAVVWHDVNDDNTLDAGEFDVTLAGTVANIASYRTP